MSSTIAVVPTTNKTPQRLKVHATEFGTILMPVLTTLRRRRCEIMHLSYAAADETGDGGHLDVSLMSPPAHRHVVPRWLENVVGVLSVEDTTG